MLKAAEKSVAKTKVLVLFGTRPEAIKLAPVIYELKKRPAFETIVVSSSQHTDLLAPFLRVFNLEIDYDLRVMTENQTPSQVCAKILAASDEILKDELPDFVFVQGDTTTAFAGAFASFNRKIKIAHVEAGLRSGKLLNPFPEEANRRLISQLASLHFCATEGNKANLLSEKICEKQIFVTGNPVIDALNFILKKTRPSAEVQKLIEKTRGFKRILLTTHRRESFGEKMSENLKILRRFIEIKKDACLIFPVHPNPNVRRITEQLLKDCERIFLLEPLDYIDFTALMKEVWLIVSDSGGVQEEAPGLGKPLLILRENTERPEAVASGAAKLVGKNSLAKMLEENYNDGGWINSVQSAKNPFGDGRAAKKIVEILSALSASHSKTNFVNNLQLYKCESDLTSIGR